MKSRENNERIYQIAITVIMVVGIILPLFVMFSEPFTRSYSGIARRNPAFFMTWGAVVGAGAALHLELLGRRFRTNLFFFKPLLFVCGLGFLFYATASSHNLLRDHAEVTVGVAVLAMLIDLVTVVVRSRAWKCGLVFVVASIFMITTFVIAHGFIAFGQITFLNTCFVILIILSWKTNIGYGTISHDRVTECPENVQG
ncbi:MAG: hypothetical protein FWE38_04895 [Firmicutes bacterium]|nr:hypothetical protein [Bacillota bacterium]